MSRLRQGLGQMLQDLRASEWEEEMDSMYNSEEVILDEETWVVSADSAVRSDTYVEDNGWDWMYLTIIPLALIGGAAAYGLTKWIQSVCKKHNIALQFIWGGLQGLMNHRLGGTPIGSHLKDSPLEGVEQQELGLNEEGLEPSCPIESDPEDETMYYLAENGDESGAASPIEGKANGETWSNQAAQGSICGDVDIFDFTVAHWMFEDGEPVVHLIEPANASRYEERGSQTDAIMREAGSQTDKVKGEKEKSIRKPIVDQHVDDGNYDSHHNSTIVGSDEEVKDIEEVDIQDFNNSSRFPMSSTIIMKDPEKTPGAAGTGSTPVQDSEHGNGRSNKIKRKSRKLQGLDVTNIIEGGRGRMRNRGNQRSKGANKSKNNSDGQID